MHYNITSLLSFEHNTQTIPIILSYSYTFHTL